MVNKNQNKSSGLYESARISGFADVWNGEWKLKHGKNHLLTNGLKAMAAIYGSTSSYLTYAMFYSNFKVMEVGTDTTTPTNFSMISLVSPLASSSNITWPNTTSVNPPTNPSGTTYYQTSIQAIWNAGALGSSVLGEFGLYANCVNANNPCSAVNNTLLTRIASADGTFSSFNINPTLPLVINYIVQVSYV
jgi:hypothetical protein